MNVDDVTSLITKLIKNPLPVLCVGLTMYFVVPQEHQWVSWVIMAWGVGTLLESPVKQFFSYLCDMREIKDNLKELNQEEKYILLECLTKSERTVYLNMHDFMETDTLSVITTLRSYWKGLHQKK